LLPSILFPPPSPHPSWERAAAEKGCSSASPPRGSLGRAVVSQALPVGRRATRFGRQARTTVYPWETGHALQHVLPCTRRASGTPSAGAHPSNERCLHRITRRHNGGPHRPRLLDLRGSGHASCYSRFGSVRDSRPRLTLAPPPSSRDAALSNRPQPPVLV